MKKYIFLLLFLSLVIVGCTTPKEINTPVINQTQDYTPNQTSNTQTPVNNQPAMTTSVEVNTTNANNATTVIVPPHENDLIISKPSGIISITLYPKIINTNNFEVDWSLNPDHSTSTTNTAIYYDNSSHPGNLSDYDFPYSTGYVIAYDKYTYGQATYLPNNFSSTIDSRHWDKIYFRAQAYIDGKNYWTPEYEITATK